MFVFEENSYAYCEFFFLLPWNSIGCILEPDSRINLLSGFLCLCKKKAEKIASLASLASKMLFSKGLQNGLSAQS